MRTETASKIRDIPIEWLWPGRIPIGRVTVMEGDPGCGKSGLTMCIAAGITTGNSWPDGQKPEVGCVIVANVEDPAASVIKPRLAAAGANLDFVEVIDLDSPNADPLVIPSNVPTLGRMAEVFNAREGYPPVRLIIIDPLDAFASEQIDLNRSQHARKALRSLELVASQWQLAVVVIRHLSKSRGRTANYRGLGSISIIGTARSAITVAKDPSDPGRSVLASVKGNWAKAPPPWSFSIQPATYTAPETGEVIATSTLRWEGPAHVTADELVGEDQTFLKAGELEAAVEFVRAELAQGPRLNKELRSSATNVGLSSEALWKAGRIVGVMRRRDENGDWSWELRGTEDVDWT